MSIADWGPGGPATISTPSRSTASRPPVAPAHGRTRGSSRGRARTGPRPSESMWRCGSPSAPTSGRRSPTRSRPCSPSAVIEVVVVGEGDPWPDVGRGVGRGRRGWRRRPRGRVLLDRHRRVDRGQQGPRRSRRALHRRRNRPRARRWNDANVLAFGLRLTSPRWPRRWSTRSWRPNPIRRNVSRSPSWFSFDRMPKFVMLSTLGPTAPPRCGRTPSGCARSMPTSRRWA